MDFFTLFFSKSLKHIFKRKILCSFVFFSAFSPLNASEGCCCQSKLPGLTSPPFAQGRVVFLMKPFQPDVAQGIIGEGGHCLGRGNMTVAWRSREVHFWKLSAEYLTQKLKYDFGVDQSYRWVQQSGIGLGYQYRCGLRWPTSLNGSTYFSYAPSHKLSDGLCHLSMTKVKRNLVSSHAWGASLGASFFLWNKGELILKMNYDRISYEKKFNKELIKQGLGGGIELLTTLFHMADLHLLADLRHSFQFFRGSLTKENVLCRGARVGVFGSFVQGKGGLPSQGSFGVELAYLWSPFYCEKDPFSSLDTFAASPAYYAPEVLTISEKKNKAK